LIWPNSNKNLVPFKLRKDYVQTRPSNFAPSPTASEGAKTPIKITSGVRSRFISQPPASSHQARPQSIFEFDVTKNAEQGLGHHT